LETKIESSLKSNPSLYIWNGAELFYANRDCDNTIKLELNVSVEKFTADFINQIKSHGNHIVLPDQVVRVLQSMVHEHKPMRTSIIRLMSYKSMNDSSELIVKKDHIENLLEKLKETNSDKHNEINVIKASYSMSTQLDSFMFCLSERPDILTQWRLYADETYGVTIGFSPAEINLKNIDPHNFINERFTPIKVLYDENEISNHIEYIVNSSVLKIKDNHCLRIGAEVFKETLSYKNPSFYAEQEWRYVSCPATAAPELPLRLPRACQWLVKNRTLTNYIECTFNLDSIKEIHVTSNFKSPDELPYYLLDRIGLDIPVKLYETSFKPT
jgi:hypothetical protein